MTKLPEHGWQVKLNHVFPEKRDQNLRPKLKQLPPLIPLGLRYFSWAMNVLKDGKRPLMNYFKMLKGKQMYGVPIGGIGAGTIGRGFKGEFCRYQMRPGLYSHHTVYANQFIVTIRNLAGATLFQQVLAPYEKPKKSKLTTWKWGFDGTEAQYCGLYPRSWTQYRIPQHNIVLTCRQISPIIPHNYKDTCLPVAVFVWTIENLGKEELNISLTFTFKNGTGGKDDKKGGCWTEAFEQTDSKVSGVFIHQSIKGMPCTYGVASRSSEHSKVSKETQFNPSSNGAQIWQDLLENGHLRQSPAASHRPTGRGEQAGCAVCTQVLSRPGEDAMIEFALSWDMPKVHFGGRKKRYYRRYTRWFGKDGTAAAKLCDYALQNYPDWEREIEAWQNPILEDKNLPEWYKSAIFNELYFISDGGSIWFEPNEGEELSPGDPRIEYGRFGYLEGHEYRMYNTYDVHFYASFALSQLWPHLQYVLQYDFRDAINSEDTSRRKHLFDGKSGLRKSAGTVPHDLGDPDEDPFLSINSYPIHDVGDWRDLNLKFVLQVFRDFSLWKDVNYLKAMWPAACSVMMRSAAWDTDGDGLIENGGFPDQTYDSWIMVGPSSYCGGLWLAALHAMSKMANTLNEPSDQFTSTLKKGKESFEAKLWNGQYYKFDSSDGPHSLSIMSDQLCGHWYLRACGVEKDEVFPHANVKTALSTIYNNNVLKFKDGTMGAVNGMLPDGKKDLFTIQSEEVWVGTVYSLAACMLHEGMIEEAFKTAGGIFSTVYDKIGMGFETPEALYEDKHYRAIGYMRPLSIWAMQLAWERHSKEKQEITN